MFLDFVMYEECYSIFKLFFFGGVNFFFGSVDFFFGSVGLKGIGYDLFIDLVVLMILDSLFSLMMFFYSLFSFMFMDDVVFFVFVDGYEEEKKEYILGELEKGILV